MPLFVSERVSVEKEDNNPFIAFSVKISGKQIRNKIAAAYYKGENGEWTSFVPDDNNTDPDAYTALAYLPNKNQDQQIKIDFKPNAVLDSVKTNFYYPLHTSYLQAMAKSGTHPEKNLAPVKSAADCDCAKPTIIDRNTWCPNNQCPPMTDPASTDVKFLIVHHSAGTNVSNDWAAVVRSIWNHHVNTNGWSDIGYNFLLDKTGKVYAGRADDTRGAHFSGHNSETSGICMMGNFEHVQPEEVMVDSLNTLLAWKACQKNIDPTATEFHVSSGLNLKTISGHRDGTKPTECPGQNLYDQLPEIRIGVKALMDACAVLDIDEFNRDKIKVYPNPFREELILDFTTLGTPNVTVEVYDATGRMLLKKKEKTINNQIHLSLDALSPGLYWIKAKSEGYTNTLKIIKK